MVPKRTRPSLKALSPAAEPTSAVALRLWLISLILVALAAFATAHGASAQDDRPAYKSAKGYSILPPQGWEVISGELDDAEFKKLPPEVQNNYNPKSADVLFMDLTGVTAGSASKDFRDCLNVAVIDETIPVNEELSKELEKILGEQYSNLLQNFQVSAFETRQFGQHKAIHIRASYEALNHKLFLYQALVAGPGNTVVLTCTVDDTRKADRMKQCEDAFASLTFEGAEPAPAPAPAPTP
jgi:hypothetical protein